MLPRAIDEITSTDIESLVANEASEGKAIDFKRLITVGTADDKKEFLYDVSSFANTAGGDLVFGVDDSGGRASAAKGFEVADAEALTLQLEQIIRDGIAPRVQMQIAVVQGLQHGSAVVIRIPPSWSAPHMVTFRGASKFYARNSAGKYQMDVNEIRDAFLAANAIPERIRAFRDSRLELISAEETPMPLSGPVVCLHVVPLSAFATNEPLTIDQLKENSYFGFPSGGSFRFNVDGRVLLPEAAAYAQVFRSGAIETAAAVFARIRDGENYVPSVSLETDLAKAIESAVDVEQRYEMEPPYFVFVSLLGFKGYEMKSRHFFTNPPAFDRDRILLPEVVIDKVGDVSSCTRGVIDMVWNAAGIQGSPNFDEQGNHRTH